MCMVTFIRRRWNCDACFHTRTRTRTHTHTHAHTHTHTHTHTHLEVLSAFGVSHSSLHSVACPLRILFLANAVLKEWKEE